MAVADDTAQAVRTQEVDYLRMGMSDVTGEAVMSLIALGRRACTC